MASVSAATFLCSRTSLRFPLKIDNQMQLMSKSLRVETVGFGRTRIRTSRLQITCAVEIVMGLEEKFDITVQEDNQDNINCIQDAADLIEQLVAKKS
ncbi:hypothetical protein C2S51_034748 [Perilla frutescens var. frutescens]|nr:hypothetical protein C2S51_034748 [Perilla frutescens var. frutescens]